MRRQKCNIDDANLRNRSKQARGRHDGCSWARARHNQLARSARTSVFREVTTPSMMPCAFQVTVFTCQNPSLLLRGGPILGSTLLGLTSGWNQTTGEADQAALFLRTLKSRIRRWIRLLLEAFDESYWSRSETLTHHRPFSGYQRSVSRVVDTIKPSGCQAAVTSIS